MINVIIPVYNSHETLPNTLDSLVAQTMKRFIVTIVDDCSDTDYSEILNNYKNKLHINYYKLEVNSGPGVARQYALDRNQLCDYVIFLDSDDMLMPNAIQIINRETQKKRPDILTTSFIQQQQYGIDTVIGFSNRTWVHGKAYSTKFLKENDIRFLSFLRLNEDGFFNTLAFGMADKEKILAVDMCTHLWIDNKSSLTRSDKDFLIKCIPDFIYGQARSLTELYCRNRFKDNYKVFAANIGVIYSYLQLLRYNGSDIGIMEKCALKDLFECEAIQDALLEGKEFNETIRENLSLKDYLYYEQQTFLDFCKEFGLEKEK